jgi:hypothetical protein
MAVLVVKKAVSRQPSALAARLSPHAAGFGDG